MDDRPIDTLTAPAPDDSFNVSLGDGERLILRRHAAPGRPALALCHGNGFATDAYAPFWAPLRGQFDLFVFDLRHHGRNAPQDPAPTGIDRYAADLGRVYAAIRETAPSVPLICAFHSLSAISSLWQAAHGNTARRDDAPDRLILFDPPIQPPETHPLHALAHGFELKLAEWSKARPSRFASPEDLAAGFGKSRSLSGWVPGAHLLMARSILRPDGDGWTLCCPPEVEARNYLDNAALISWDLFNRIGVPVSLIGADPQHPAGQSPAQVCAALAADRSVDYREVPGTTHMLQLEKPEASRAALLDCLA